LNITISFKFPENNECNPYNTGSSFEDKILARYKEPKGPYSSGHSIISDCPEPYLFILL